MATVGTISPYTFEDFCVLVREGQKADLIDGVIYMASPDNTDANGLFMWLGSLMDLYSEWHHLGRVYGSRVAFRLDAFNSPEPDIGFILAHRLRLIKRGHVEGGPDLAVEIVSPDSIERDYSWKRAQYEQAGVTEYWIVDEMKRKIVLLRLDARRKYREVRPRNGILRSRVLTGFWLRPEWLWQEPRPNRIEILQQMLASQE